MEGNHIHLRRFYTSLKKLRNDYYINKLLTINIDHANINTDESITKFKKSFNFKKKVYTVNNYSNIIICPYLLIKTDSLKEIIEKNNNIIFMNYNAPTLTTGTSNIYSNIKLYMKEYIEDEDIITIKCEDDYLVEHIVRGNLSNIMINIFFKKNTNRLVPVTIGSVVGYNNGYGSKNYYVVGVRSRSYNSFLINIMDIDTKNIIRETAFSNSTSIIKDRKLRDPIVKKYKDLTKGFENATYVINQDNKVHVIAGRNIEDLERDEVMYGFATRYKLMSYLIQHYTLPDKERQKSIYDTIKEIEEKRQLRAEVIKKVLEISHPNNYEFQESKKQIIIHYPEVIISNDEGIKHKMKDLYVFIMLKHNYLVQGLQGLRGSINYFEYKADYAHSHLSGINKTKFCLGGTELAELVAELSDPDSFDEESFETLIYQLDSLVKWESISGGPYRKLKNLQSTITPKINYYAPTNSYITNYIIPKVSKYLQENPQIAKKCLIAKLRFGVKYYEFTLNPLKDILTELGFHEIIIMDGNEYLFEDYIKALKKSISKITDTKNIVIKTFDDIYKGQQLKITLYPLENYNEESIDQEHYDKYISNHEVRDVEYFLTDKLYKLC